MSKLLILPVAQKVGLIECCYFVTLLLALIHQNRIGAQIATSTPQTVAPSLATTRKVLSSQNVASSTSAFSPTTPSSRISTSGLSGVEVSTSSGQSSASSATAVTTTTSTTTGVPPSAQPKFLKFTLVAGKFWKFNIKASSFSSSHKEKELRLHKIVSATNYIIDDDNWFQYNPQQQQLFAWPSLSTAPATYYFVLIPSSIDLEADGENNISGLDIAANIVVELIKPVYQGGSRRSELIDQFIDYKFSLDYLHRHSSHTLLLQQIISVFDYLSRSPNHQQSTSNSHLAHLLTSTTTTTSLPGNYGINQQGTKYSPKLSEILLINSNYSITDDLFSITWSIHPSLVNNTISPISECRVASINDTIAKLAGSASGYLPTEDENVIELPLDTSTISSQAILPTEKGNHAVKLKLNSVCQRPKILEELGLHVIPSTSPEDVRINAADWNTDKETSNNTVDTQAPVSTNNSVGSSSRSIKSDAATRSISSEHQAKPTNEQANLSNISISSSSTEKTLVPVETNEQPVTKKEIVATSNINPPRSVINESELAVVVAATSSLASTTTEITIASSKPDQSTVNSKSIQYSETSPEISSVSSSTLDSATSDSLPPLATTTSSSEANSSASSEVSKPLVTTVGPTTTTLNSIGVGEPTKVAEDLFAKSPPLKEQQHNNLENAQTQQRSQQQPPQQQQTTKMQPQAKSFANFLDANDSNLNSFNYSSDSSSNMTTTSPEATVAANISAASISLYNSTTASPPLALPESSLNEDFMGILKDSTDYLVARIVPISIVIGGILLLSIIYALCMLCIKRKKSKQVQLSDRFGFRYGSERRVFLKNSSKPVILEADQKSLSMGGTPQHKANKSKAKSRTDNEVEAIAMNNYSDPISPPRTQYKPVPTKDTNYRNQCTEGFFLDSTSRNLLSDGGYGRGEGCDTEGGQGDCGGYGGGDCGGDGGGGD